MFNLQIGQQQASLIEPEGIGISGTTSNLNEINVVSSLDQEVASMSHEEPEQESNDPPSEGMQTYDLPFNLNEINAGSEEIASIESSETAPSDFISRDSEPVVANENAGENVDYFSPPSDFNMKAFLEFHPKQESNDPVIKKSFFIHHFTFF